MWNRQKNALIAVRALIIINGKLLMGIIQKRPKKRYAEVAEKRGIGKFIGIRREAFLSEAWAHTSSIGIRLIMDLAAQYNGKNNGDMRAAWRFMYLVAGDRKKQWRRLYMNCWRRNGLF